MADPPGGGPEDSAHEKLLRNNGKRKQRGGNSEGHFTPSKGISHLHPPLHPPRNALGTVQAQGPGASWLGRREGAGAAGGCGCSREETDFGCYDGALRGIPSCPLRHVRWLQQFGAVREFGNQRVQTLEAGTAAAADAVEDALGRCWRAANARRAASAWHGIDAAWQRWLDVWIHAGWHCWLDI